MLISISVKRLAQMWVISSDLQLKTTLCCLGSQARLFGGGDVSDDITLPKGPLLLYDMQKQTMHDTIMCVYRGLVSMGAVGASQSLSKLRVLPVLVW